MLEKYTKQKTTPAAEKIYEVYATKYFKRAPGSYAGGNSNHSRRNFGEPSPAAPASQPQRFAESRFIRDLVSQRLRRRAIQNSLIRLSPIAKERHIK